MPFFEKIYIIFYDCSRNCQFKWRLWMITIDLKYTLVCLVLIALFVLLIMLAVLVKNLVSTIKNLNKVVDDASTVSKVASDRASQVDGIVGDLGEALGEVTMYVFFIRIVSPGRFWQRPEYASFGCAARKTPPFIARKTPCMCCISTPRPGRP